MEFIKALKSVVAKQKRKSGTRTYYSGSEVYFSRLFGYRLVEKHYLPDERFAKFISKIFELLAEGKTLPEIKAYLDEAKAHDSSNNRFSLSRITAIAERPIYAGFLYQRGRLVKIENLTPIVSLELWKSAQRQLRVEKKKMI